jgi:hypothetical protein
MSSMMIDTSIEGIKPYRTMIGCLQRAVSLGPIDIPKAVMIMLRFRVAPRKGHLDRLKQMYGCLKKFATGAIRIRVEQPNLDDLPSQDFDWCYSVYGNVKEVLPKDLPWPLEER